MASTIKYVSEPYVDDETEFLAKVGRCPICGTGAKVHIHRLDAGELREVERVEAGREWRYS